MQAKVKTVGHMVQYTVNPICYCMYVYNNCHIALYMYNMFIVIFCRLLEHTDGGYYAYIVCIINNCYIIK